MRAEKFADAVRVALDAAFGEETAKVTFEGVSSEDVKASEFRVEVRPMLGMSFAVTSSQIAEASAEELSRGALEVAQSLAAAFSEDLMMLGLAARKATLDVFVQPVEGAMPEARSFTEETQQEVFDWVSAGGGDVTFDEYLGGMILNGEHVSFGDVVVLENGAFAALPEPLFREGYADLVGAS